MLYGMLSRAAREAPRGAAIIAVDAEITYRQLKNAVDGFAGLLAASGVRPAEPVALLLPNSPAFVVGVLALARLGAIAVPLNPSYQQNELTLYLRDCGIRTVLTVPSLHDKCAGVLSELGVSHRIFTSVDAPDSIRAPAANAYPPSTPMLYQYSSGSMGTPKRITRTHGNLVAEADSFVDTVGLTSDDRILTAVPLFHAHGFGNCLLAAIRAAASMILLESFGRQRVLDALLERRATLFPGVPFMFDILASSPSIRDLRFPRLALAFSAGAPLPRATFDKFMGKFGVAVRQLYGSTETGAVSINLASPAADLWASVGLPMRNVDVRVADCQGRSVAPGETGEVIVKSPAMGGGYAGLPQVNRETFKDGYFWTGDLGKCDRDGNLFITGRKKLFINAGGLKVDPLEVEDVLRAHPLVAEAVVLGVPGSRGEEIVKAVVVSKGECGGRELQEWCSAKIARFKIPRVVEFRSEIPKSPVGKVLRKYLQDSL